ncbi:hypothetical protein ACJW30_01G213400 [Castanea mollissima]
MCHKAHQSATQVCQELCHQALIKAMHQIVRLPSPNQLLLCQLHHHQVNCHKIHRSPNLLCLVNPHLYYQTLMSHLLLLLLQALVGRGIEFQRLHLLMKHPSH